MTKIPLKVNYAIMAAVELALRHGSSPVQAKVIAKRQDILNWARTKVENKTVHSATDALYKLYSRQGRKDLITKVRFADLLGNFSHTFLIDTA